MLRRLQVVRRSALVVQPRLAFYHATSISLKKSDKSSNKSNTNTSSAGSKDEAAEVTLPNLIDFEVKVKGRVERLELEYAKIRGGRASPDMFNHLEVDAYGSRTKLAEVGQISLKTPTKINISVFDPSLAPLVAACIRDCGQSLNPEVEGTSILVNIPKPSNDARKMLVKSASQASEKTKLEIRNVRKNIMDKIKNLKGEFSDDDLKRISEEAEKIVKKNEELVVKVFKDKEKEILTV